MLKQKQKYIFVKIFNTWIQGRGVTRDNMWQEYTKNIREYDVKFCFVIASRYKMQSESFFFTIIHKHQANHSGFYVTLSSCYNNKINYTRYSYSM